MKRIAEERQLTGVYGPLIDNFVLKKEEAAVAVDVTAGNRLASHKLKNCLMDHRSFLFYAKYGVMNSKWLKVIIVSLAYHLAMPFVF